MKKISFVLFIRGNKGRSLSRIVLQRVDAEKSNTNIHFFYKQNSTENVRKKVKMLHTNMTQSVGEATSGILFVAAK